jgi:hypothetical protein
MTVPCRDEDDGHKVCQVYVLTSRSQCDSAIVQYDLTQKDAAESYAATLLGSITALKQQARRCGA